MKKITKKQRAEFQKLCHAMLQELGCRTGSNEFHYDYVLDTTCGELYIDVADSNVTFTVFTRFRDIDRVQGAVSDYNPCSGKWNFHISASVTSEYAVDLVRRALERILPVKVQ